MGSLGATVGWIHDRLEQCPEDGRRNRGPVELPRIEQCLPHRGVEGRDAKHFGKQIAVDVREAGQVLVKHPRTVVRRRVQHLKQLRHPGAEVGAIGSRAFLDEVQEDIARLEDARVVGEQAEHGPYQEQLQVVAAVAGCLEHITKARDQLGGLNVDRILIAERAALHADDEPKLLDVLRKVGEGEAGLLAFVPVEQPKGLEVAEKLEAGRVEILMRSASLTACGGQITTSTLLLNQQNPRPEQIDEARGVVEQLDAFLVPRHVAAAFAEDLEELVVKALRFALFVRGVGPFAGELAGARSDLVPGKSHHTRQPMKALLEVLFSRSRS